MCLIPRASEKDGLRLTKHLLPPGVKHSVSNSLWAELVMLVDIVPGLNAGGRKLEQYECCGSLPYPLQSLSQRQESPVVPLIHCWSVTKAPPTIAPRPYCWIRMGKPKARIMPQMSIDGCFSVTRATFVVVM